MASNWRFWHCGVVVRDIARAADYYESLGIGPFEAPPHLTTIDKKLYGKPAGDAKNLHRLATVGPVQIELSQPVAGKTPNREYLDKHGEGISHIAFFVDDIDEETAKLVERGFKAIWSGKFVGGGGFAYFDTDKVGGVIFELLQGNRKIGG